MAKRRKQAAARRSECAVVRLPLCVVYCSRLPFNSFLKRYLRRHSIIYQVPPSLCMTKALRRVQTSAPHSSTACAVFGQLLSLETMKSSEMQPFTSRVCSLLCVIQTPITRTQSPHARPVFTMGICSYCTPSTRQSALFSPPNNPL